MVSCGRDSSSDKHSTPSHHPRKARKTGKLKLGISAAFIKSSAITALEHNSTMDHRLQRTLERAVKNIGRSFSHRGRALFIDDYRILPPPDGEKVFREEREAVERLLKAIKRRHTSEDIKLVIQQVIGNLVEADRRITEHCIATAQRLVQVGIGNSKKVAKAQREFEKAIQRTNAVKAIHGFAEAWKSSQEVAEGRELLIKTFQDAPDPFFAGAGTCTLSVAFQIREREKRDHEKRKSSHLLELVWIIQDSTGSVVRRLTTWEDLPGPKGGKGRPVEISVSGAWDGRDEEGKVVLSGTYSYNQIGKDVGIDQTAEGVYSGSRGTAKGQIKERLRPNRFPLRVPSPSSSLVLRLQRSYTKTLEPLTRTS